MSSSRLRIVMPVLNEGADLVARLRALTPLRERGAEVVVVDGGSTDSTWAIARRWADAVLVAPRGRASQMNAGARWVKKTPVLRAHNALNINYFDSKQSNTNMPIQGYPTALVFLHADTHLPAHADRQIADALQAGHDWGRFDVRIQGQHPLLPMVAALMNWRSRWRHIATGDQAIFVRRSSFEAVGGFPDQPLMEDIALSAKLARLSPPACLSGPVVTSGRRWDQHGFWRTVLLMWQLRWAYWRGASPHALAARYGYAPSTRNTSGASTAAVAVLAKAPVAGFSKTRLIPALGAQESARVQRRFTFDTLHTAQAFCATQGADKPLTLWCAPDATHRFFRAVRLRLGIATRAQTEGDLGQRMAAVFADHFHALAAPPLLLIGTDCPVLSPDHLTQAAQALRTHDVVLIPAEDGGYVLIGMRRFVPQAFNAIAWSTPQVLVQTRERLRSCGATWVELPTLWDVDEPSDWARLQAVLSK